MGHKIIFGGLRFFKMKLLSLLALSSGVFAQYNTCTDIARCDYQCSSSLFGLISEGCTGNNQDLACCTETEACDLVNAATLTCLDLPYLDDSGVPRTYVCCGGSDNGTDGDAGGDTTDGDTDGDTTSDTGDNSSNSTVADTTTIGADSSASQLGASVLAIILAKIF